jgi:hypothetical protein
MRGARGRFAKHLSGQGRAPKLWEKIQELGGGAFQQTIIEAEDGNPIEAEQRWYDWYLANDPRQTLNGRRPGGWDDYGVGRTPWNKGKPRSLETRAKISTAKRGKAAWNKGKSLPSLQGIPRSAETRAKISASNRGQTPSLESRAKMSAAQQISRWECSECSLVSNGGGLALHQKASKHQGILRCK